MQSNDLNLALLLLLVLMLLLHCTLNAAFSLKQGFHSKYGVDAITSWMSSVDGDVLVLKMREFVTTRRSIDTGKSRLIPRHILPSIISPIIISTKLRR